MQVVVPDFEATDDSKEFSVVDVIVLFCCPKRLGQVRAWVPFSIGVGLQEYAT